MAAFAGAHVIYWPAQFGFGQRISVTSVAVGADKLPLVMSDNFDVLERLQSSDVLINQQGTVVWAAAAFATDNVILRSDGTGFGSQLSGLGITDGGALSFGGTTRVTFGTSTILRGDVEIQNGTNSQALRVYNTFTDDSNHEALAVTWNEIANVATIETQSPGTGSPRSLSLGTDGTPRFVIGAAGNFVIGGGEDFIFALSTGTKLGTSTAQKLGFWNKTPIVQPADALQAALINSTSGSQDGTLDAVSGSGDDSTINDNFTDIHVLLNEIRDALVDCGIMKGAV